MSRIAQSTNKLLALLVLAALLLAACGPQAAGRGQGVPTNAAAQAEKSSLYVEVVGLLEALGADSATVGGMRLVINNQTQVADGLQPNQLVEAKAVLNENGLAAVALRQVPSDRPMGHTFELSGIVESMAGGSWVVGGHTVRVEASTEVNGSPAVGDLVKVEGSAASDGTLVAREIQGGTAALAAPVGPEIEFVGVVSSIGASQWVIGGQPVTVAPTTEIKAGVALGASVKVHASPQSDGSLLAREIELAAGAGDGTATPQPGNEQEFTGALTAVSGDVWTIGGVEVRVTSATEVKGTFQIGDVLKVHATAGTDGVLVAREVELAAGDDGDDDDQGDDDDGADEQEFTGVLSAITGDVWTVGEWQVRVTSGTEIKGALQIGDLVKVHASLGGDDILVAREIEHADDDDVNDDDDSDDSDDDHSGSGGDGGNDDDDDSGSSGGDDDDDDNSGSGGDDDDEDDDDNSGSGGGDDDHDDDNGSGDDD